MPPDEEPPTPPEFQPPVTPAPSLQEIVPPVPPPNFPDLPAVVGQPFPPASSVVWSGPEYSRSPVRSVPLPARRGGFRRTHSMWKPRFSAEAAGAVHRPRACEVHLAPLQLQLPRLNHPRRQTHRLGVLRPTSTVGPDELKKVEMNRKEPLERPQRKTPENPLQVRIIRSAELRGDRRGWRGERGCRRRRGRRQRAGRRPRRRSKGLWR
jgi:hypothetical protein